MLCLPPRAGSPGRSRFLYLAVTAVALLLTYHFVLSRSQPDSIGTNAGNAGQADITGSASQNGTNAPLGRELVFAAMRDSNMSWVKETMSQWPANIYRADAAPGEAELTVPANRGNEAMVYLTYIIDRYFTLPDVVVFLHGSRYQWHNDNPLYDTVIHMRDLQTHYVRQAGYVSLRCTWSIGCPAELHPARYFRDRPDDPLHPSAIVFPDSFMALFPGQELPETVGTPCCSQFAVSRERIHMRDREEYIRMRRWLLETELDAGITGRILEYAWHMVFGQPAQYCPDRRECYCNVYGYCKMSDDDLKKQWVWRGIVLPEGWPNHDPMFDFH